MTTRMLLADRYELVQPLGRGGMGQVWLAVDRVLDRQVAVKTVDLDASRDPAAAERFRREAKAAAALSHDNVVTVFDSGTDGPAAFMVMQLLPGPTLEDVIRDRAPLPLGEALALGEQTASALAATHRIGIVHRDIKPGNLMFDDQGRLKVVDFGIARLTESMSAQLTAPSMVVGSVAYMAPEQARGEAATPATDLYALGCVMTALLTGRPPFEAEHPMGALQQHLAAAPPRLRDRRSDVPEAVDALVDGLLAKEPGTRPSDAGQVAERLRTLRAEVATSAGTLPMPAVLMAGGAAAADGAAPAQVMPPAVTGRVTDPAAPTATRVMPPAATAATRVMPPAAAGAPDAAPRRRRFHWRVLAGLAAVILLALLLPPLLSGIGDNADPGAEPAAPGVETPTAAEPAPAPSDPAPAQPAPEQPAPATVDTTEALTQLRAAVDSVAGPGDGEDHDEGPREDHDEGPREDLAERVEDIEKRLADGRMDDMANKLEELVRKVDELEREEELVPESAAAIRQAVAQLEASLG